MESQVHANFIKCGSVSPNTLARYMSFELGTVKTDSKMAASERTESINKVDTLKKPCSL